MKHRLEPLSNNVRQSPGRGGLRYAVHSISKRLALQGKTPDDSPVKKDVRRMLVRIAIFLGVSVAVYFGIAAALILFGVPGKAAPAPSKLSFDVLRFDTTSLPGRQAFAARDGSRRYYRRYPSSSKNVLVLLHGSGWHSGYLLPLASYISENNLAVVYTPDLRGHGSKPERRGDIDYIGQLEDDLADLLVLIDNVDHPEKILLSGHSSGGGLALRFAGSRYRQAVDGYLLIAPYLKYNAPTTRQNSGGWAVPYTGRIIGLSMLGNVGLHGFDDLPVISFNLPEAYRDGTETLVYTYRMNTNLAPDDYKRDLEAIHVPLKVIVGSADEAFFADKFAETISPYAEADISVLPNVTHLGAAVGPEVRPVVGAWLKQR